MKLNSKSNLLIAVLLLFGCTTVHAPEPIVEHPPYPVAIQKCEVLWRLGVTLEDPQQQIIGLTLDDGIKYRACLEDIRRYVRQTKALITYYREAIPSNKGESSE